MKVRELNHNGFMVIKDVAPIDYFLVKEADKLERAEMNENDKGVSIHSYAIALLTSIKNLK